MATFILIYVIILDHIYRITLFGFKIFCCREVGMVNGYIQKKKKNTQKEQIRPTI